MVAWRALFLEKEVEEGDDVSAAQSSIKTLILGNSHNKNLLFVGYVT